MFLCVCIAIVWIRYGTGIRIGEIAIHCLCPRRIYQTYCRCESSASTGQGGRKDCKGGGEEMMEQNIIPPDIQGRLWRCPAFFAAQMLDVE